MRTRHLLGRGHAITANKAEMPMAVQSRAKVRSISVSRGENGGHVVRVAHESGLGPFVPDKEYPYGPDDHERVMDHVAKFIGYRRKKAAASRKGQLVGAPAHDEPDQEPDWDEDDQG